MKFSINWLNSYLEKPLSVKKAAEVLERSGLEIEGVSDPGHLDDKIVVAEVLEVKDHPGADKLKLAHVSIGRKKTWVVCGAPNVTEGMKAVLASVGASLPDGTQIREAEIRGQQSNGMLCSARELGWGDDHDGIVELDDNLTPGDAISQVMPQDTVIDVTAPANRWDLLSIVGLAREVSAQQDMELVLPKVEEYNSSESSSRFRLEDNEHVERYMLAELEIPAGEKVTPKWMKDRIESAGMRSVNAVVDVTNYVMLEWGQPLHAFDADSFEGTITVRQSKNDEEITTLDGVQRRLSAHDLVITSGEKVLGIAGVMGADFCEVNRGTTRIYLEAATFRGSIIRKSAQRHGLRTEASARFERNLPVELPPQALARAIDLLEEVAGAKLMGETEDQLNVWPWVQHIGVRTSRVQMLTKLDMSAQTIAGYLHRLGFEAEGFDAAYEAKKHLGTPYKWGANFKQDGVSAFDCSYFTDYIYSLIGRDIGHTALAQYMTGKAVLTKELRPGDILFYEGVIDKSVTDHYYRKDESGRHRKVELKEDVRVGHCGLYIGEDKVIDARQYQWQENKWKPIENPGVVELPVEEYLDNPGFLGARRYVDNLEDYVAVTVPWWRSDIKHEHDVVEELVKLVGYDSIEASLPPWRPKQVSLDGFWNLLWQIKDYLRSSGLFEVNTYSFVSENMLLLSGENPELHLKLKNPLSKEQAFLRRSLRPSLVHTLQENRRYGSEFGVFEVSKVFVEVKDSELPDEPLRLAVACKAPSNDAYRRAKAVLDLLAVKLGLEITLQAFREDALHPKKAGQVSLGGEVIGVIGELHPALVQETKIQGAVGYLEIDLMPLIKGVTTPMHKAMSKFPSIARDLSFVVKRHIKWADVSQLARKHKSEVEFISDFYGSELGPGYKAMTIRLHVSSTERTMTDEEADTAATKLMQALVKELGVKAR